MNKIMTIYDIYEIPDKGLIIGGLNPEFDAMSREQIRKLIGNFIEIHKKSGPTTKVHIMDVQISNSLINKKNIDILLPKYVKKEDIERGDVVYSM